MNPKTRRNMKIPEQFIRIHKFQKNILMHQENIQLQVDFYKK